MSRATQEGDGQARSQVLFASHPWCLESGPRSKVPIECCTAEALQALLPGFHFQLRAVLASCLLIEIPALEIGSAPKGRAFSTVANAAPIMF